MGRIAILLCALGILAPAARLAAQEPASEAGPLREMVGMMEDWFWHGGETELFEGRLPSDLPEGFPTGAEVLGSLVRDGGFSAFLTSPLEPDEWAQSVESGLVAAGWERREEAFPRVVGFVAEIARPPTHLCLDGEEFIEVNTRLRDQGGSAARVDYSERSILCDPTRMDSMVPHNAPVPPLTPPAGATMMGPPGMSMSHWVGRDDEHRWVLESGVTLETAMPLAEVIDHYGSLLEARDWTAGTGFEGEETGLGTWTYHGERGEWRAFLLALPDGQGHELLFRVDGLPESEIADEPRGD